MKPKRKLPSRKLMIAAAAVLVLGIGGFVGMRMFLKPEPPPPPPPKKAPVAKSPTSPPAAGAPAAAPLPNAAGTPSETLNQIANAPANAINRANGVVAARDASGQRNIGDDLADKPATAPASAPRNAAPATQATTGMHKLSPGLSATTALDASVEASPAFKTFVNNAKITSVIWSTPARAFINGRMYRAGDMVDSTLGISFEAADPQTRQLIFKDKSGAIAARKY